TANGHWPNRRRRPRNVLGVPRSNRSLPRGEQQRCVVTAEAERVTDRCCVATLTRLAGNHVQLDLRVELFQIASVRYLTVIQRQDRSDRLDSARTTDEMAETAFRGRDHRMIPNRRTDRRALADIADNRRRGVRVAV